jgi:hypothetical protein
MVGDSPHMTGQRSNCLGRGVLGTRDTAGHATLDTAAEAMDMSGRPFEDCYSRWQPAQKLPSGDDGQHKRRAFLDALVARHPDKKRMSEKQFGRWMNGEDMTGTTAKACADVLIGTDPNRASEHRQFAGSYGPKSSRNRKPTAARTPPTRLPPRTMHFPRLFSFSVEIPSQNLASPDPAATVPLLVEMNHATEPVEGLSFRAEIALKRVVFTVDCDTCQPKVDDTRAKNAEPAARGLGVPANGIAYTASGDSFNGQNLVRELMVLQPFPEHTAHTAIVAAETDYDSLVPIVPGSGTPNKRDLVLKAFLKQACFKRYGKLPLGKVAYPWGDEP